MKIELDEQLDKKLHKCMKLLDLDAVQTMEALTMMFLDGDFPFLVMEYGKHHWVSGEYDNNSFYYSNQHRDDPDCNCFHCLDIRRYRPYPFGHRILFDGKCNCIECQYVKKKRMEEGKDVNKHTTGLWSR